MSHPQHHTPAEWDVQRAEIRRLYIDDDRTLQCVMGIMSQRGFTATTKMYKTQLKRWKLFKNNRAADVAAILRSQCRRNAVGKGSIAVRNGRRVNTETYLRRKGLSADDLLRLAPMETSSGSLPLYLRSVTPPVLRPPSPMQGVLLLGLATPGLGIKEAVGSWVLRECERLEEQMGTAMVIDSGVDCETTQQDRPLLSYYESTASKLTAEYYDAIWLLQKSQSHQGWALAHTVFERLHTLLDDCEHLLYPVLNLLMIILALPLGEDAATAAATADIHHKLWDYLSSYARIRLAPDHIVHHVLRQLSELFSQQQCSGNNIGRGDGDDRYDLLYSVVSDIVNMLGSRKDKNPSGNQTMYYDLVSLWYGETLRSHRGHRQHGYHPRLHLAEDEMFAILNSGKAAGASAASSSSSSPQWSGAPDDVDPLLDPNSMEDVDFDLDIAAINSYLLLDLGWQTAWHDRSIPDACAALLQAKEYTGAPPDETEVNCLTAMALYERAQCIATSNLFPCPPSTATVPLTPDGAHEAAEQRQRRLVRAQWLLSEAVSLDWDLSGASIYNFEGLLLLQEWCAEIGDWNGLEAVRARSRECLDILFGEWGV